MKKLVAILICLLSVESSGAIPVGFFKRRSYEVVVPPATNWVPTNMTAPVAFWTSMSNSTVGFTNSQTIGTNIDNSVNAFSGLQLTSSKQPLVVTNSNQALNSEKFDGVDDYISLPTPVSLTNVYTCWVVGRYHKAAGAAAWTGPMYYQTNLSAGFAMLNDNGTGDYIPHLTVYSTLGVELGNFAGTVAIGTGVWHHVVWTVTNALVTPAAVLYTNGVSATLSGGPQSGFTTTVGAALGISWGTVGKTWEIRDAGVAIGVLAPGQTDFINLTNYLTTLISTNL